MCFTVKWVVILKLILNVFLEATGIYVFYRSVQVLETTFKTNAAKSTIITECMDTDPRICRRFQIQTTFNTAVNDE